MMVHIAKKRPQVSMLNLRRGKKTGQFCQEAKWKASVVWNEFHLMSSSSVSQDLDEWHGEQSPLGGARLEVALHPVLVLGLLVEDHDDVALLEGQLVVVVGLAVVQRPAPPEVRRRIVPLLMKVIHLSVRNTKYKKL